MKDGILKVIVNFEDYMNGKVVFSGLFLWRGDAHKFYLKLKKTKETNQKIDTLKQLKEIQKIQSFYSAIPNETLKKINYRMIKEKNGSGMIPIIVTAVPWLLFLFSNKIQDILFKSHLWIIFIIGYLFLLILSVLLHFHEKSWCSVHITIIQDIIEEREQSD